MTETDVFAYGKSGLDRFLFAEIGIEQNGSSLTVLSALARNGDDPWEKAAQWAKAPRAKVVQWLAATISLSHVAPETAEAAQDTAARLVHLLPSPGRVGAEGSQTPGRSDPGWGAMMLLAGSVAITLAVTLAMSLHPNTLAGHPDVASPATRPVAAGQ